MATALREYLSILVLHETELWNLVDRHLHAAEGTVTLGRLEILRVIGTVDTCRIQDVADRIRITVGTASRLTDRLEADGLVARSAHPTDRRSSQIELTDDGRRALDATEPAVERALAELLSEYDTHELAAVTASLRQAHALLLNPNQNGAA
jgi:DNA-binding MarR family transcriptional regulator